MREAHVSHSMLQHASFRRRFEDLAEDANDDAISFFFDLKLMLPAGLTATDFHRARLNVERRLHRTVRRKDRIAWTDEGFFLLLSTTDPARAGAAAERINADICAALGKDATSSIATIHEEDPRPSAAIKQTKRAKLESRDAR